MKLLLFTLLAVSAAFAAEIRPRSFYGYQVLTVEVTTKEQYYALHALFVGDEGYDFWTHPKIGKVDIMVSPAQRETLGGIMNKYGMKYAIKIDDVERLVSEERVANARGLDAEGRMTWTAYQRWSVVEPFLNELPSRSPWMSIRDIGSTVEGRSIKMIKISSGGSGKPSILIDALFHAREWISGAVATWFLNDICENPENYAAALEDVDIYVVPFTNIDGYEYSHTNDRMWRKNRRANIGTSCYGIDPNRNFAHYWGGQSTSPNPCSDIYIGTAAFSEPETSALRNWVNSSEIDFKAYMTIHSYGQLWLCPWGHTQNSYPPDYQEILGLAQRAITELESHFGTRYIADQGADSLYAVGGASDDYMKFYENMKYTYTLELRDQGQYGFTLPPAQIVPTARETTSGMMVVIKHVGEEYGSK
jgi:murein tripeptide amidase MpaA